MFRRLFWMTIGIGFGFGVALWVGRAMRRYSPERLSSDLSAAVRGLGADLRAAVAEGREAMREREAELRAGLHERNGAS